MIAIALAVLAAAGTYLVVTAWLFGWQTTAPRLAGASASRQRLSTWLTQAGLHQVAPTRFLAVLVGMGAIGALLGGLLFAGVLPALMLGGFAATSPLASYRQRRRRHREDLRAGWPAILDEMRVLTGAAGSSIPQALLAAGEHGPASMRSAFESAHREWILTTDFERTLIVLKATLADATTDLVCETLLIAHQVGGTDVDRRLAELGEDRRTDLRNRRDAVARQAGARFARRFVLLVPLGMALAGLSVGNGRAAYQSVFGQVLVAVGLAVVMGCWWWAGRIMRLPEPERVFAT